MPKKLLMNNTLSIDGLTPVMDGLICWVDQKDGYEGNTVFDRTGNNHFLLEDDFNGNPFALNNNHKMYSPNILSLGQNFTIQISILPKSISTYGVVVANDRPKGVQPAEFKVCNRNNNRLGAYTKSSGAVNNGVPIQSGKQLISTVLVKGGIVHLYGDSLLDTSTNPYSGFIGRLQIGSHGNDSVDASAFDLYSIMIYNRALTDAEIKQNYEYEKAIIRG